MRVIPLALSMTLTLSWAAACGGPPDRTARPEDEGEGGEDAPAGAVPALFDVEAYCQAVAKAACELTLRCDNETLFDDRHGTDVDGCMAALAQACVAEALPVERAVAAGAMTYGAASLVRCLDAVAAAVCTEGAAGWGLLSCERGGARTCDRWFFGTALDGDCQGSLLGALREGDGCYDDRECEEGLWCNLARCSDAVPGVCAARMRRGEQCAFTPLACERGLICAGTTNIKKCKPLALEGEECTLDSPAGGGVTKPNCEPPLQCISGAGGQQGGGVGGSFGTCQRLSPQLGACGQGRAKCEPDSYCDFKSIGSIQGDCQPFKGEDEDCKDDADPRQCGAGMYCFARGAATGAPGRPKPDGRCERYQPLEGLCAKNHYNCLEGWCPADAPNWEGFCQPFKESGQDCSASYQCAPGSQCIPGGGSATKRCVLVDAEVGYVCLRPPTN